MPCGSSAPSSFAVPCWLSARAAAAPRVAAQRVDLPAAAQPPTALRCQYLSNAPRLCILQLHISDACYIAVVFQPDPLRQFLPALVPN